MSSIFNNCLVLKETMRAALRVLMKACGHVVWYFRRSFTPHSLVLYVVSFWCMTIFSYIKNSIVIHTQTFLLLFYFIKHIKINK